MKKVLQNLITMAQASLALPQLWHRSSGGPQGFSPYPEQKKMSLVYVWHRS